MIYPLWKRLKEIYRGARAEQELEPEELKK